MPRLVEDRMSGRVYERKFDWDEARRLRKEGMTYVEIASLMGVSATAVRIACDQRARATSYVNSAEYARSGVCVDCGGRMSRNSTRPQLRCLSCHHRFLRETAPTVRDTELRCFKCERWLPDLAFPHDRNNLARRGRHRECTDCQTAARRAYRERHKVPCVNCGAPRLAASETKPGMRKTGLCVACYQQRGNGLSTAADPGEC